jgi:ATP-dependent Clp protease adaptor protein ClpS
MPVKPLWENDEDVLVDEDLDLDLSTDLPAQIIVYNDDHNTFEWVIECFIDILGHTSVQAEQLALIIHTKGKATVKTGPKEELLPLMQGLNDRGLSAVIEEG